MDEMRSIDGENLLDEAEPHHDAPPAIGGDERRMHVRAYNFWVALLGDRAYPTIADLDATHAADFSPYSVLLDFTGGMENPAIAYLGEALRGECGEPGAIATIADVPSRSLLSRLTDHYLQILANRAPIGFEAEFVGQRGRPTMYRGILMPFSSDDETIDFVYGVINWKELAEPAEAAGLAIAVERAMLGSDPAAAAPIWADGPGGVPDGLFAGSPSADVEDGDARALPHPDDALADHLAAARQQADQAQAARLKSRAALYRALGLAYDFALLAQARPEEYAELLEDAGIRAQARAPMTAVVKLVFGQHVDKARATEFAAALSHAGRIGLPPGRFADHVEGLHGGVKAMVAAEREARRPASAPPSHALIARAALRKAPARAWLDLPSDGEEFVLLLARRDGDGRLAILAPVPEEASLVDRAIRKITH